MTGERMLLPGRALPRDARALHALPLLGAIVLLLIVGLLGMHALGSAAGGHGASAPPEVAVGHASGSGAGTVAEHAAAGGDAAQHAAAGHAAAGHAAAAQAAAGHAAAADAGSAPAVPAQPSSPSHEHSLLTACVLALLAGLIVLVRPTGVRRDWLDVVLRPASAPWPPAARRGLPPPSLTLLSISRT